MKRSFICLLLFFYLPLAVEGQQYLYNYYTEKDGLCGNHVYNAIQDSKGYIWFSTSTGVSLYDGTSFQNFGTGDGLTDYEVLSAYEDREGRIWFKTFNGLPCFYYQGKFYNPGNHPLLQQARMDGLIRQIHQDQKGHIWIGANELTCKIDFEKNKVTAFPLRSDFYVENTQGEMLLHVENNNFYNCSQSSMEYKTMTAENKFVGSAATSLILSNGNTVFSRYHEIYYYNQRDEYFQKIKNFSGLQDKEYITAMHEGQDGQLYFATNNGVLIFKGIDFKNINNNFQHILRGKNATSILLDHQGSIWVTTSNGVYQISKEYIQKIDDLNASVIDFAVNDKYILIAAANKKISVLQRQSLHPIAHFELLLKPKKIIQHNNEFYILTNNGSHKIKQGKYISEIFRFLSLKDMAIRDDFIYVAESSGLYKIAKYFESESNFKYRFVTDENLVKQIIPYRVFYLDDQGSVINVSTIEGLFKIENDESEEIYLEAAPHEHRIITINQFGPYKIIGTEGNGLYIYLREKLVRQFNLETALASNFIKNTFIANDLLYVVTSSGIHVINQDLELSDLTVINKLGFVIYKATMLNDDLALATSEGMLLYSLANEMPPPHEHKSEITAKRGDQIIRNGYELDYKDTPIDFSFKLFNFTNAKNNFSYRLSGANEKWQSTTSNSVSFQNLKSGKYEFQLMVDGKIIKKMGFLLYPPFWQRWWFYGLTFLMAGVMIYGVYKWLLNQSLRKQAKKHLFNLRIAKAEQDALKAQMNPHFIFNSLNAIQNLILHNRTDNAYSYLGDFSKLVRNILNNSRTLSTTVAQEISFLNLYLKLESMRFDSKFEYEITQAGKFNIYQNIPSMVIQPFVENGVIHGLLPLGKNRKPKLKITFREDETFIYCSIDDNGVGRSHAPSKSFSSKESLGLKITEERLLLYDHSGSSNFDIIDKSIGTLVEIMINKHV